MNQRWNERLFILKVERTVPLCFVVAAFIAQQKSWTKNFPRHLNSQCWPLQIFSSFNVDLDSSLYAHYVFKAFDVNCNGAISFRDHIVTLSTLLRGSVYERLKWTFKLYDLNGDGCISRGELAEVVTAVHELMGKRIAEDDKKTRDQVIIEIGKHSLAVMLIWRVFSPSSQVDRVFKKLDLNQDGVITIEEFLEACLKDDLITKSLEMFDKGLWWPSSATPTKINHNNFNRMSFKGETATLIQF